MSVVARARRPYEELSRIGRMRRMRRLAEVAVGAYPVETTRITPLTRGFNTTFRVDTADGGRHVLRIQRTGGPSPEMVRSEMTWLAALRRDTGLVVPEPVPTRDGDLLTVAEAEGVPGTRSCVLYRWVNGRFADDRLTPAHLERVGALMARLQSHGAEFAAPEGFHRGAVDHVTSFGRTQDDGLSPEVAARAAALVDDVHSSGGGPIVQAVIERARTARDSLGRDPAVFGLIHADLHQENYLFHRGEARAIDFDDCGYGPYVYDLAVTLSELKRRPDYPDLRSALLYGYRGVRPLPASHERLIDVFIALRAVQLMMWTVEHRDQPMFREAWATSATRTLDWLRSFLDGA
ncbi:phosphotransferase enzyme family protein [Planotetraspora kaengkrachanensis]|uniref:Aminoglycoside phosphotransferase n=1 Tax=Planotetraspora kaengkrachanensis TaxID=575193 RepID=A0A8J3PSW2_9ACTN|nr:phosphotransferase [Planotetraspora kaengkrachanensis]GIG79909.1 aminoglycoside phosphotransferase [Planotetraspora kaengkrachanensis]